MKKLLTIVLAVALMGALFPSCKSGGDPKEAAKETATSFLNSIKDMDYTKAKEYGTESTGQMLEMMSSYVNMMPDSIKEQAKKATFTIDDVQAEGNEATIKFTPSDGNGQSEELKLIKQDDKWLVDMKMPEGPAPDMEAPMAEPEAPAAE